MATPPVPPPETPEGDFVFVTQAAAARTATAIYNFFNQRIDDLEKAVLIGDERLADHIAQQVQDIREALRVAEALEKERVEGLRREIRISSDAVKEAISKQERADEGRFAESQKLADKQNEVVAEQIEALRGAVADLKNGVGGQEQRRLGVASGYANTATVVFVIAAVVGVIAYFAGGG